MLKLLRLALLTGALAAATAAIIACGGGEESGGDNGGTTPPATARPSGDGGGDEVEFEVSMGDNSFEPKEFTVGAGDALTFNVTNDGSAIHNMRIAGADNEYNNDDDAVTEEEIISGGQSAVLNWEAPEEAGDYDFRCDFHTDAMTGTITVE